jgi:bacterioferritin (cytochrome b1)
MIYIRTQNKQTKLFFLLYIYIYIYHYLLTKNLQQSNIHEQTHQHIIKKFQHQCQAITSWINLLDPPNLIVKY